MKTKYLKFSLLMILFISNGLAAQITFQKNYGSENDDYAFSVKQTSDGGNIIAGYTFNQMAGNFDVYLIKTNATGDLLWTKIIGGINGDWATSVQQTSDGGYIITGYTEVNSVNNDVLLIKTDANGSPLWTKSIGGSEQDKGYSVCQTTDGGYVIAGYSSSFGSGLDDAYLIKTNSSGQLLWTKTYGGFNVDYAYAVEQTNDGGYILAGNTRSSGVGLNDFYVVKTDNSGNIIWSKTYGGGGLDNGYSVCQTNDGEYIIVGSTFSFGAGLSDVYIIKTDANGGLLWTTTCGGEGNDFGNSVMQTTDGGYIIAGTTSSFSSGDDVYLIKTDANGNILWTMSYGELASDQGSFSVHQTTNGGYLLTGYTTDSGIGDYDVYLIKTDANGNSGCNQISPPTIIGTTTTLFTNPNTTVSTGGTNSNLETNIINGGIAKILCFSANIDEINEVKIIDIFPNPFTDQTAILLNKSLTKTNLMIFDILGQMVETKDNISGKEIILKRENLPEGLYFIRLTQDNKIITTNKLIAIN